MKAVKLDKTIREILVDELRVARLGRNPSPATQDMFLAKMLFELESSGDAMRTMDAKGNICWKATPALRDRIADRRREAEDELAGEEI